MKGKEDDVRYWNKFVSMAAVDESRKAGEDHWDSKVGANFAIIVEAPFAYFLLFWWASGVPINILLE